MNAPVSHADDTVINIVDQVEWKKTQAIKFWAVYSEILADVT